MRYVQSDVCQIDGLTCFGCCGNSYTTKEEILETIRKNTGQYDEFVKSGKPLKEWLTRSRHTRACGICFNVIEKKGKVFCPGHPILNDGEDLRDGYCDIHYLCKTAYWFKKWDSNRKLLFIKFIKSKNLTWYSFSRGMDNDSLLQEFYDENNNI